MGAQTTSAQLTAIRDVLRKLEKEVREAVSRLPPKKK